MNWTSNQQFYSFRFSPFRKSFLHITTLILRFALPNFIKILTFSYHDKKYYFHLVQLTNPSQVEQDGVELIHFQADELKPGHVIVGRFGVYLHNTLRPDKLNMDMSVVSYSAPIHNNGRQLDTVQS